MVSYKDGLYKLLLMQVMDAPTIPVSADENLRDPIDIRVDIIYPEPVATISFLAAAVVRTQEKRARMEMELQLASIQESQRQDRENLRKLQELVTREANVVTDALSRKERIKPLRVRALVMTIGLDLPKQILNAQTRTLKPENLKHKDVGVVHFGKRGKLNPIYVGPFQVLAKVGAISYKLELPQEPSRVHNTFHVSNLKKCYADEPIVVPLDGLHIDNKHHFVEETVEIMDREVKRLRQSRVLIIKVRWNSRRGPDFTWEREDQFQKKYLHLFTKTTPSPSAAS
ncbi:hypothetical protein Tco_1133352 [Tanacetum coccineum]